MTHSSALIKFPEWLTKLKETFIFTSLLKETTDEQLDEEIHKMSIGRSLSQCSWGLGVSPSWCGCVPQQGGSLPPVLSRFYEAFIT